MKSEEQMLHRKHLRRILVNSLKIRNTNIVGFIQNKKKIKAKRNSSLGALLSQLMSGRDL